MDTSRLASRSRPPCPASGGKLASGARNPTAHIPGWSDYLILIAGAVVLAVGGLGLWMADNGLYSAELSIPIGLVSAVALVYLGCRPGAKARHHLYADSMERWPR